MSYQKSQQLVEEKSQLLATLLGVPQLKLDFWVSKKCKSDYGMCSHTKNKGIRIKLSEFVIGTPYEECIVEHEVAHAYVDVYMPERYGHGPNFKSITNGIFKHDKLPITNVVKSNDIEIDSYNERQFIIKYEGKVKAKIKFIENNVIAVIDSNNQPFEHYNTRYIYYRIFDDYMKLKHKIKEPTKKYSKDLAF